MNWKTLLSPRQYEIAILLIDKNVYLDKEIAYKLKLTLATVNAHRQTVFHKLGVGNRVALVHLAYKEGLLNGQS